MLAYLIIDCETTTFAKGNPYSQQNKLCLVGLQTPSKENYIFDIEYSDNSYKQQLSEIQDLLNETNLLVLFNAKFDLAWLRRYGLDFSHCRIHDCQLVHFILTGQQEAYPSLNGVAEYHNLGTKLDEVKEQYWKQKIDTTQIPLQILTNYLKQDLLLTQAVFLKQQETLSSAPTAIEHLVNIANQDLLVLLEMEYNGIKLDFTAIKEASLTLETQIETIKKELYDHYNNLPPHVINFASNDCLSTLLYGGSLPELIRTVSGQYKTGPKVGRDRHKLNTVLWNVPRQFTPPKGSELKKEGFYATNEETLRNIKTDKQGKLLLDKLLKMSKLEKLNSTYYKGLQDLAIEKDWEPNYIHGQFNQCIARTGRLSSSGPNLQNFPPEIDQYILTRF